ncbi:hypothetical protein AB205_0115520 [Aquarana catesbeiana]|uniref:Uncharacterized protein n=1 Tax=Aquarana catesbeiana TaxID=8400 RepID=A0A2G9QDR2_AQUCT|nr:hypothetical protein AB205_0115520 [Aquarana catesbeiana]
MSRKQMGERGLRKLTTFLFPQDKVSAFQDSAGGLTETREAYTDLPDDIHNEMGTAPLPISPTHDPGSDPLTSSPAKARMWMDTPQSHSPHVSTAAQAQAFNPFQSNQALHNSMASFPTSGQPVIDTTLKEMLMSLQTSLMTDLSSLFSKISTEMHSMDNRISNMERGMTECSATTNPDPTTQAQLLTLRRDLRSLLLHSYELIQRKLKATTYSTSNKAGKRLAQRLKGQRIKSKIPTLSYPHPTDTLTNPQDIANAFSDYYSKLYNIKHDHTTYQPSHEDINNFLQQIKLPKLTDSQLTSLNEPFSDREILDTISSLPMGRILQKVL